LDILFALLCFVCLWEDFDTQWEGVPVFTSLFFFVRVFVLYCTCWPCFCALSLCHFFFQLSFRVLRLFLYGWEGWGGKHVVSPQDFSFVSGADGVGVDVVIIVNGIIVCGIREGSHHNLSPTHLLLASVTCFGLPPVWISGFFLSNSPDSAMFYPYLINGVTCRVTFSEAGSTPVRLREERCLLAPDGTTDTSTQTPLPPGSLRRRELSLLHTSCLRQRMRRFAYLACSIVDKQH
jgi:hypothetical protein